MSSKCGHFDSEFIVVYLRVVQGCNLNCTHCFTLGNRDRFRLAEIENIRNFLRGIREKVNPSKVVFYIHGGEPFLAPREYLSRVNGAIREFFSDIRHDIIPQTNLMYRVDDEFVRFVKQEYRGNIGVSWDVGIRFGSTLGSLGEDLFLRNFRFLATAGVDMAVAITVQRHLLNHDPIELARKLNGATSLDFEFLTTFDEKTCDLKVRNEEWAPYFERIVRYYSENETTWAMPQVDLFTKSFLENKLYRCKCNCCSNRTFTLNCDGTIGLCPDEAYFAPISDIREFSDDWSSFRSKAAAVHARQLAASTMPVCMSCEFFEACGGNCDAHLFTEGEQECPLSRSSLRYQFANLGVFKKKLGRAHERLPELREES